MNKRNRAARVWGCLLSAVYVPLSVFSLVLCMASEATIGANNPWFVGLIRAFCAVSVSIPLLCIAGAAAAAILRKKGRSAAALGVMLVPPGVFVLNLLLLALAHGLPPVV